jgi:hypothetical protein
MMAATCRNMWFSYGAIIITSTKHTLLFSLYKPIHPTEVKQYLITDCRVHDKL